MVISGNFGLYDSGLFGGVSGWRRRLQRLRDACRIFSLQLPLC
jgi:hypothetical protein